MADYIPNPSTVQGKVGRKCTGCGAVFHTRNRDVRIDHICEKKVAQFDLELDMEIEDGTEVDLEENSSDL